MNASTICRIALYFYRLFIVLQVALRTMLPRRALGCVQGTFTPSLGNAHAHTSYSDGAGYPQEAFQRARTVAKLDFLVVTDHLEQLYIPLPGDRLALCLQQAAQETVPGLFLAARSSR